MKSVSLSTPRLVLDQPAADDIPNLVEYCRDPLFERYLTTPWPYQRTDAEFFVGSHAPDGWEGDTEYTWAIRRAAESEIMGAIGCRFASRDIGYWLGAPHRGLGYMTEAVGAITAWMFSIGWDRIGWECVVGNGASASVARKSGFRYTGERPARLVFRDGSHPVSWHGELLGTDSTEPKPGWPA